MAPKLRNIGNKSIMKKLKAYAALAGGVALIACWPLVVGQIGQKLMTDNIAKLSNTTVTTELVSYQRGYLSSSSTVEVKVVDPNLKQQLTADGMPTRWLLDSQIQHQLFSLSAVTTFADYPEMPLTILSESQLNGDTHFVAKVEQYEKQLVDAVNQWTVSLQPSQLIADVTLEKVLSASATIPQLKISSSQGEYLTVTDIAGKLEGQMQRQLWVGEQSIHFGSIEIGSPVEDDIYLLEGLDYLMSSNRQESVQQGETIITPSLFSSSNQINIDKLILAEQQIDQLSITLNAGDLDANSLNHLLEQLQAVDGNPTQRQQALVDSVDSLFNHGFYLHLDKLGFAYLNQPVEAKVQLQFSPSDAPVSRNPMQIVTLLNGELFARVPKALANQVPNLQRVIDQLQAKEYITETDSDFEFTAKVEQGNLLFSNGQKLPIITALMPLFMR